MIANLIVCTSFKTSYNVLNHSHWGLGQSVSGGGGGAVEIQGGSEKKRESLQSLDLQRLASLLYMCELNVETIW